MPNEKIFSAVAFGAGKGINQNGAEKYNVSAIVPSIPHAAVSRIEVRLYIGIFDLKYIGFRLQRREFFSRKEPQRRQDS